jgi:probable rRNA maturation factor
MPGSKNFYLFNTTRLEFPIGQETIDALFEAFIQRHSCAIEFIEIVLVDETEIKKINREYLNDIISFHYHDRSDYVYKLKSPSLEGTMYCCLARIIEQSAEFNVDIKTECLRIVVHGLLHILGFEDATKEQKKTMTLEEDAIIQQITI